MTSDSSHTDYEARVAARARRYRHIGYSIVGGLAAAIAIFLLYHISCGLSSGQVYDPFTGEIVSF
ncbi:MAG: hypothetical protein FWC40_08390 [Proteobacteria bacterium]|nr:hypothetical protein [Pseudomonadota bacterium]